MRAQKHRPSRSKSLDVPASGAASAAIDSVEADRDVEPTRTAGSDEGRLGRSRPRLAEKFALVEDLADALGAAVGASRAAVDAGYIPANHQEAGMWNIFIALMTITLAFAFFDPNFFVAYLMSIAVFGLFQAIYMANAGGAWDNAKKLVEVDLKEKGTDLHAATVVGDTVGDPFKDTTSVALNPIIKFSTLFGLLAVEIAVEMKEARPRTKTTDYTAYVGVGMLAIALIFVWRSFYAMRIPKA